MIGMRTILQVTDNSGASCLACILPLGGDVGLQAGLGDVVTASVKEAASDSAIPKGKVVKCVIVRMRKETRRRDGSYIRFDENAAVLINDAGEPVGTRVFGVTAPVTPRVNPRPPVAACRESAAFARLKLERTKEYSGREEAQNSQKVPGILALLVPLCGHGSFETAVVARPGTELNARQIPR